MIAYKLIRVRKDGTLGPLFINRAQVIPTGKWLTAEDHHTPGYARRPGWHAAADPIAPHLKTKLKSGEHREWYEVEITGAVPIKRPACQGTTWYVAKRMRVLKRYS